MCQIPWVEDLYRTGSEHAIWTWEALWWLVTHHELQPEEAALPSVPSKRPQRAMDRLWADYFGISLTDAKGSRARGLRELLGLGLVSLRASLGQDILLRISGTDGCLHYEVDFLDGARQESRKGDGAPAPSVCLLPDEVDPAAPLLLEIDGNRHPLTPLAGTAGWSHDREVKASGNVWQVRWQRTPAREHRCEVRLQRTGDKERVATLTFFADSVPYHVKGERWCLEDAEALREQAHHRPCLLTDPDSGERLGALHPHRSTDRTRQVAALYGWLCRTAAVNGALLASYRQTLAAYASWRQTTVRDAEAAFRNLQNQKLVHLTEDGAIALVIDHAVAPSPPECPPWEHLRAGYPELRAALRWIEHAGVTDCARKHAVAAKIGALLPIAGGGAGAGWRDAVDAIRLNTVLSGLAAVDQRLARGPDGWRGWWSAVQELLRQPRAATLWQPPGGSLVIFSDREVARAIALPVPAGRLADLADALLFQHQPDDQLGQVSCWLLLGNERLAAHTPANFREALLRLATAHPQSMALSLVFKSGRHAPYPTGRRIAAALKLHEPPSRGSGGRRPAP